MHPSPGWSSSGAEAVHRLLHSQAGHSTWYMGGVPSKSSSCVCSIMCLYVIHFSLENVKEMQMASSTTPQVMVLSK